MTELQAHQQGNMPGNQLYGSRCNLYTFPITRIPRPQVLDNLHSRQNNTFTRDRFQAWASVNKHSDDSQMSNKNGSNKTLSEDTLSSTDPLIKMNKPFVAAAAFPDDIPRLVEVEFAAFQDETVNHVLSYRDASNQNTPREPLTFTSIVCNTSAPAPCLNNINNNNCSPDHTCEQTARST
jgi:hypothetical protein